MHSIGVLQGWAVAAGEFERHIENVYNRLGISGKAGRAIVTAYAMRHGLVPVVA